MALLDKTFPLCQDVTEDDTEPHTESQSLHREVAMAWSRVLKSKRNLQFKLGPLAPEPEREGPERAWKFSPWTSRSWKHRQICFRCD